MQITIPGSGHYFLCTSKGENIPIGARVDVAAGTLRYVNGILASITVGLETSSGKIQLEKIGILADDATERHYDESEEYLWGKWDGYYETLDFDEVYDVSAITLHTIDTDASTLYELATHGLSKDEFIKKLKLLMEVEW